MARKEERTLEDLLGGDEDTPTQRPNLKDGEDNWAILRRGVTIGWLAGFLGMHPDTVKKRLGECPALSNQKGRERYDPKQALGYLITPKFDIKDYIRGMNPNELPPMLRKEYWQAEKNRLDYEERAGELWRTEAVIAALGMAFKHIKNQTQVFADDVEREGFLTPEQYKILNRRVDSYRDELFKLLCELPKESPNVLTERSDDHAES